MPASIRDELDIFDQAVLSDVVVGELRLSPKQALRLYHEMSIHQ